MRILAFLLASASLSACASDLIVTQSPRKLSTGDNTSIDEYGLPMRLPALVRIDGHFTTRNGKSGCDQVEASQTGVYPLGELYYIDIEPGPLASGDLTVQYAANGLVSSVAMDSEPVASQAAEAATGFVGALNDLISIGDDAAQGDRADTSDTDAANLRASVAGLACTGGFHPTGYQILTQAESGEAE